VRNVILALAGYILIKVILGDMYHYFCVYDELANRGVFYPPNKTAIETPHRDQYTFKDSEHDLQHIIKNQYRQKYGRDPPANFRKWIRMASAYKCSLNPSDYEQIDVDLRPFRARRGRITRQMIASAKRLFKRAVYHIVNGSFIIEKSGDYVCDWRLLQEVAHLAPRNKRVTIVLSCSDELRVLPRDDDDNEARNSKEVTFYYSKEEAIRGFKCLQQRENETIARNGFFQALIYAM
jgi:hypothetical protein